MAIPCKIFEIASLVCSLAGVVLAASACSSRSGSARSGAIVNVQPALAETKPQGHEAMRPRAPHAMVTKISAHLAASQSEEGVSGSQLDEAMCRKITNFVHEQFDRCTVQYLANRSAVSVHVVYDCGAHLCSVESFVWYGDDAEPYVLRNNETPIEVTPDHRYLLMTEFTYPEIPTTIEGGVTLRIDRKTGTREKFLNCFSAVLSPGGRYYVCRDIFANVLRVKTSGGEPELVVKAELPENESIKLGGPFNDYPAQVEFPNLRTVEYEIFLNQSGEVLTKFAPWRE